MKYETEDNTGTTFYITLPKALMKKTIETKKAGIKEDEIINN